MRRTWKARLAEVKAKAREYAPEIVGFGLGLFTFAGWAVATYHKQQLLNYQNSVIEFNPDEHLAVPPELLRDVREKGAVFRHWIDDERVTYYCTFDRTEEEDKEEANRKAHHPIPEEYNAGEFFPVKTSEDD